MKRPVLFAAAAVLLAGLTACSSTPKPTTTQPAPGPVSQAGATAGDARSPVVPAGFPPRLSNFSTGKDCKT